jgi:hypothetical protein
MSQRPYRHARGAFPNPDLYGGTRGGHLVCNEQCMSGDMPPVGQVAHGRTPVIQKKKSVTIWKKRARQGTDVEREGAVAVRRGEVPKAEVVTEAESLTVKQKKGKWNVEGVVPNDGEKAAAVPQPRQPQ